MPKLDNARHEKFSLLMARGLSAAEAYRQSGYAVADAATNTTRLTSNEEIRNRIREHQERIARKSHVDAAWVLTRLKRIADKGETDMARNRALELIAKAIGMFEHVKRIEHSMGDAGKTLADLTPDQFIKVREIMIESQSKKD